MNQARLYLRVFGMQLKTSLIKAAQYRFDFVMGLVMAAFWTSSSIVPLFVLFANRTSIGGWSWYEALIVVGWFNILKGVLDSIIQPALTQAVEHIRKGTLDFVLLKPLDAQFLVSTSTFEFKELADSVAGIGIVIYALAQSGHVPSACDIALTLLIFVCAVAILYSIWVLVMSLAFVFVKIDNLSFLFSSVFDAARWPSTIYRGTVAFVFTFVLPLALMTTYPSLALLHRISLTQVLLPCAVAAVFLIVSRLVWSRSVGGYTSAGG